MESTSNLSMEQQFKLQVLSQEVRQMSREQAQQYSIEVLKQMMLKENLVNKMIKGDVSKWLPQG